MRDTTLQALKSWGTTWRQRGARPSWAFRHLPWVLGCGLLSCSGTQTSVGGPTWEDAGTSAGDSAPPDRFDAAAVPSDALVDRTSDGTASTPEAAAAPGVCPACVAYGEPKAGEAVASTELPELSGIAASRVTPGAYFVHNDSGDSARFFALLPGGGSPLEFRLAGATATDWEDLAIGPCDATGGSCIFLGDIGDNAEKRTEYSVYRVREPALVAGAKRADVTYERFRFQYPDGSHNAETLLAHPTTGDLYVVTKSMTASRIAVYRLPAPLDAQRTVTLEKVSTLTMKSPTLVTGGDIHPCGDRVLVRTYDKLFEHRLPPGRPFAEIFATEPIEVPVAREAQGEAVGYRSDGLGYVTVSEMDVPFVNESVCK